MRKNTTKCHVHLTEANALNVYLYHCAHAYFMNRCEFEVAGRCFEPWIHNTVSGKKVPFFSSQPHPPVRLFQDLSLLSAFSAKVWRRCHLSSRWWPRPGGRTSERLWWLWGSCASPCEAGRTLGERHKFMNSWKLKYESGHTDMSGTSSSGKWNEWSAVPSRM